MRAPAFVLIALLAGGCLEAGAPPESLGPAVTPSPNAANATDARGRAGSRDDPAYALRYWTPCADCQNATGMTPTLDVFFASGRAMRAELSSGAPLASGMNEPSAAFVVQTLTEIGARDLVPTRISTVELPATLVARIRGAVEEAWSPPVSFLDQTCEKQCPTVFGRASANGTADGWEVLEVPATPDLDDPRNEPLRELYSAFFAAAHVLEMRASATPSPTQPTTPATSAPPTTTNTTVPERPPPRVDTGIVDWQGQDSEFGSIRAPYQVAVENGTRAPIEARVVLRTMYEESGSRFFMFRFDAENMPLDVAFDDLVRVDTGEELPCYQRQGDATTAISCFVDLKDMPAAGTEVRMLGTVGASRDGSFQVGWLVVPFTYTWTRVQMSNGLNAELYAGTQVVAEGVAPPRTSP